MRKEMEQETNDVEQMPTENDYPTRSYQVFGRRVKKNDRMSGPNNIIAEFFKIKQMFLI
jgi:hypothetical protein